MLKITDLVVQYGSITALHGVSLEINEHEVIALIGNNGAGKTTTLRSISGTIRPASGDIRFNGKSLLNVKPHEIVHQGIIHVPEGRKIFPKLTVKENLLMGAYSVKDAQKIAEAFEQVIHIFPILGERLKQFGGTLSGGEQQMLAVGRAMMAGPKLLLLDEPSLGLAPQYVDKIADTILEISGMGVPILLVEQNANLALELSDRAYVIETGYITMSGKSSDMAGDDSVQKAYLGIS